MLAKKTDGKKKHTYVQPLNTATQQNIFIPPYGFLKTSLGTALLKPSRNIVLYQRKGEEVKKKRLMRGFTKHRRTVKKKPI